MNSGIISVHMFESLHFFLDEETMCKLFSHAEG